MTEIDMTCEQDTGVASEPKRSRRRTESETYVIEPTEQTEEAPLVKRSLLARAAEMETALMRLHTKQNQAIAKLAARFEAERTALVESDPEAYAMMTDAHAVGAV